MDHQQTDNEPVQNDHNLNGAEVATSPFVQAPVPQEETSAESAIDSPLVSDAAEPAGIDTAVSTAAEETDTPPIEQTAEALTEEESEEKPDKYKVHVAEKVHIESAEHLASVLEEHQAWLETVLNPRKKIGAGRADITGSDLSGFDLSRANFSGATLKGVRFIGADLSHANLTGADCREADFQGAKLEGAVFKRANLADADLRDTDISTTDFRRADTTGAHMPNTDPDTTAAEAQEPEKVSDEPEASSADEPPVDEV